MSKKRIILNLILPLTYSVLIMVLGIIIPRLVMTNYGSDTNGLISTIGQIFTYMALLEAGVSRASRNQLFKPLVERDSEGVSKIICSSKKYYQKIAIVYFVVVILLSSLLPFIFKTKVAYWEIFFYILLEGLIGVVNFLISKKWTILLNADGKMYVVETISFISKILGYAAKIVLILLHFNIAVIQSAYFIICILTNVIYIVIAKQKYSWINTTLKGDTKLLKDKNSYFINEIAWTIFSSTDMIVLSIFLSTSLSSVYSIYALVFVSINTLVSSIYNSLEYILGKTFQKSDISRYTRIHDLFQTSFISLMTILMSVSYVLTLPFVKLYTNGVHDVNYIHPLLPLLFCLIQILSWSRYVPGNLCGLGGYAKQISIISIVEAGINIVLSCVFVLFWSIEGVLLATVCALPIKIVFSVYYADVKILKRKPFKTIGIILTNIAIFAVAIAFDGVFNKYIQITNVFSFIKYGFVLTLMFAVISLSINSFLNKDLKELRTLIKNER